MQGTWFNKALKYVDEFKGTGLDPFGKLFEERRKTYTLTTQQLTDAEIERLRKYIFSYDRLPLLAGEKPVQSPNLIAGAWKMNASAKTNDGNVVMQALFDKRVTLSEIPDSGGAEVEAALSYAFDYWQSFEWVKDSLAYRKHVVKNFSRMLNYFYEECITQIRTVIPKTRIEADKDFWEAKRAADHLEGEAVRAMTGGLLPTMIEGHTYWKNPCVPAGISAIFTPMNFIYGIPVIQFIGAYLVGAPFILKGHPFGAICSTSMMKMLLAAGANPRMVQKIEGFGKKVQKLVDDPRVAVVCLTGGEETALHMTKHRGLRPTKFEGGGCNWSWIDDGFSDDELLRIAIRLTYSKLGFSSHKCTTLNGIAASVATMKRLLPMINQEIDNWVVKNPALAGFSESKVVGPCMVHKAQTASDIQSAAERAGVQVYRRGGKVSENDYTDNAEVIAPIILSKVKPGTRVTVNWDGRGEKTFDLATTEFFMPILIASEMESFEEFLHFCLFSNPHDLAVSVWSRNEQVLSKGRKVLAGMLKENDGTDSAFEWEEFGASGCTGSGNIGVGEASATFAIYSRCQKGRHVEF